MEDFESLAQVRFVVVKIPKEIGRGEEPEADYRLAVECNENLEAMYMLTMDDAWA
jgi:hypothetical protein